MCGRYTLTSPVEALRQLFDFAGAAPNLGPRHNIAPTQRAPVIRLGADGGREMQMLSWGLVPYWAEDISLQSHMINARGETVAEKPAFRQAFRQRRCLVPADGFYEWPTVGAKSKQPFLFRRQDKVPFAFAGLWERWVPPQGEVLESFTIVNIAANATMAPFHDRIPVILDPLDYAAWRGLFEALAMKVATFLFVAAMLAHAWIGLREIFIDYLHCARCTLLRLSLYFAFAVLYLACLVWTVDILWSVR